VQKKVKFVLINSEKNGSMEGEFKLKMCVYPGSFDPVTNGHVDIIERGAKLFDKLIVAVLVNQDKNPYFSMDERVDFIKSATANIANIEVYAFKGLLIDFMKSIGAKTIIKGLRAVSDFEYEMQMALLNKTQEMDIETLFMMTSLNYSFLSSSSVRELAKFGGNIDGLVPECIKDTVLDRLYEKPSV
jgi:pantetheine-phosphate adenylyltransferase